MIALDAAKKYKQPKEGSKEAQLREMRKAGSLPKHAGIMLDDGAPAAIIRLGKEKPAPLVSATAPSVAPKRDFRIPKGMSTEEGNAMLARLESEKKTKAYQRVNKLRESKGLPPIPTPEAKASAVAESKETDMRTKTDKKAATAKARSGKSKGTSKRDQVVSMVCRVNGTTCAEACKAIGWKVLNRSTLLAYCKAAGVKVRCEEGKDDKPDRYFGAAKEAKAA